MNALASVAADDRRAQWFVVQTKQHSEGFARAQLESKGLGTYLPLMRVWPRPAVGSDISPVFPSYVFVQLQDEADYYAATWTPGVKSFVKFGQDEPARVPAETIDLLREREGPDGLVRCGRSQAAVHGARVRISCGVFKDFCGVVEQRLSARERVVLLMNFLARQVRVDVPERWLRSA